MRENAGSAAAPAARWRKFRRGSFMLNPPSRFTSLDHLVGAGEQSGRDGEAERLSGEQIDDEIEFGRLLDWDVGRLGPTQNLVDKVGGAPKHVREVWSIGHQTARFDKLPKAVYRRQSGGQRQRVDANPVGEC